MRTGNARKFLNDLTAMVGNAKVNIALKVANGSIKDMSMYNRQVGQIEGMENCIAMARDLLGRQEAADDDGHLPEMTDEGASNAAS